MRYILIGILVYIIYLILKFILGFFQKAIHRNIDNRQDSDSGNKKRKIDLTQVEDADFEDISKNTH